MEVKSQFWRDGWLPMISIPKLIFIFSVEELPDNGQCRRAINEPSRVLKVQDCLLINFILNTKEFKLITKIDYMFNFDSFSFFFFVFCFLFLSNKLKLVHVGNNTKIK